MPDRNATRTALACYRCGTSLEALSLPLARLDLCPECDVELHVCRMCKNYAPSAPDGCSEEDALEVRNKTTANFCDYFEPSPNPFDGRELKADNRARAELDALFGTSDRSTDESGELSETDRILDQAEALFKK
jgi:hypothetical protein